MNTDKSVLYYAKIEFAGRLLGESARIEVKEGETEANFNVTTSLETSKSEQDDLSQVINNPLLGKWSDEAIRIAGYCCYCVVL